MELTWDDPGDDTITGYQVLRRNRAVDGPGVFHVHVDDTGSAATSYTDTTVAAETFYVYRVKARNAGGLSPRSSYFNAETPAAPEQEEQESETRDDSEDAPAAPSLIATALSPDGDVLLSWRQDPADDSVTGYRILRGESEDALAEIVSDTGSADTTYTDTGPPAGRTLHYAVQARNGSGLSEQSNTLSVTTPEAEEDPVASEHNEDDHGGQLLHDKIHISNFNTLESNQERVLRRTPVHRMRVEGNAGSGFRTRATFLAHGVAQQFRTGSASDGYDLGVVRLALSGLSGYAIPPGGSARDRNIPIVSIWSSSNSNPKTPAARLHTLINSRDLGQQVNDFYGVDVHLAASTDYFLVVENLAAINAHGDHGIGTGRVLRTGDIEVTTTPGFGRPANLKAFTIDVIRKATTDVVDVTDHNPSGWHIRRVKLDRFFQRTGAGPAWCVTLPTWASGSLGSSLGGVNNTGCNANVASTNGHNRSILRMALFAPLDASEPFFENFDGHDGADPVVLRVPEDAEPGSVVGTIPVHSLDGDAVTISVSGASAGFHTTFAVNAQTGAVTLRPGASLDFEGTTPRFTADLSVTDGEAADGSAETTPVIDDRTTLTIKVTDVDEPSTFTFVSNRQLDPMTDRPVAGETITVTFDDPDGPIEFNTWIYRCRGGADVVNPPDGTSVLTYSFTPQEGDWQCNSWMLVSYRDQHGPQAESVLFLNRVERPDEPSDEN